LRETDARIAAGQPTRIAFVNANLASVAARDASLTTALREFTLLNDGVGVDLASALLYRRPFGENLNGTDFTPAFLDRTRHDLRVYLLGAKQDVLERACARFAERWPRHAIVGARNGYWRVDEADAVAQDVKAARADLVLVAMGNPLQERWVAQHVPAVCPAAFCVGAWFDFLAEAAPRAPQWVRQARMEWAFRLVREPARLSNRYIFGNAAFVTRSFGQYLSGARA
jgi:alpha-1,3-mannosyltransferase